jgi:hypothetical protein
MTALQTARLTLRPYALTDIPALLPLIGARDVAATTLRIPHPYTESLARDYIAAARDEDPSKRQRAAGDSDSRIECVLRRCRAAPRIRSCSCRTWLLDWRALLGQRLRDGSCASAGEIWIRNATAAPHLRRPFCRQHRVGQGPEKNRHALRRLPARSHPEMGRVPRSRDVWDVGLRPATT